MLQAEVYFAERSARADMSAFDALTQVTYQATLQGYEVRYVEADSAFTHYCLASPGEQTQLLKAMLEPDVLVLDDLFLARRISDAAAELLQTLVHRRYNLGGSQVGEFQVAIRARP